MSILGSVGQLYMFVLLVLLFAGLGFSLWRLAKFMTDYVKKRKECIERETDTRKKDFISEKIIKGFGGQAMGNNGWLKLAVFSLVGIVASVILMGLLATNGPTGNNLHAQHSQQGINTNSGTMGNMQMQNGAMQGMNSSMNSGMYQNELLILQQQMYQMQMQFYQMQQQMGMMNGNTGGMQMQQGGMNSMGNMNMGSMSSMPQNNSGMNMQQNNNGMGMMGMGGMM